MKDNEIVEILEDGTIYYFDLDVCNDEADKLLTELYGKEGKVSNFDFTASIFNLFVNSVHILHDSGWSVEELIGEVLNHTGEFDDYDDDDDD